MARNRTAKFNIVLSTQNTWVQVPIASTGKEFIVRTSDLTLPYKGVGTATVEVALSVASPGGAGTVLEKDVGLKCMILNAATHTLWARRTDAGAGAVTIEVDPDVNGITILMATA